jgi:hypothetical protein
MIMARKTIIPRTVSGFTDYIKLGYGTAEKYMTVYGIDPNELAKVKPLFDTFVSLESLCANPATATKGNRDARNIAWTALEKQWRVFLNKEIRLNDQISIADREIFGILPHDSIRTPSAVPKNMGTVTVMRTGEGQFDLIVEEASTGKKKRPADASGSNLYAAVTEVGDPAPYRNTFRFKGFSSKPRHTMIFTDEYIAKRVWVYVRYTNRHGQEGPEGPLTSFIVS